jgi:hypothetical protein
MVIGPCKMGSTSPDQNPDIALQRTVYDQGKPPCDKDTHVDILEDIITWINNVFTGS